MSHTTLLKYNNILREFLTKETRTSTCTNRTVEYSFDNIIVRVSRQDSTCVVSFKNRDYKVLSELALFLGYAANMKQIQKSLNAIISFINEKDTLKRALQKLEEVAP